MITDSRMPAAFTLLLGLVSCIAGTASAGENQWRSIAGPVTAEVIRIIDGDTIEVDAHPWPGHAVRVSVRLRGIDTPERRSRCADQRAAVAREAAEKFEALHQRISIRGSSHM